MSRDGKVAVLGAGAMGHGIAQVCAASGYDVALYDVESSFLDTALERIERSLARLQERGNMDAAACAAALARIDATTDLRAALQEAWLVIEAVPERLDVKQRLYQALDASGLPGQAIVASNTSTIPIGELARSVSQPQRFVGIHFFNPPQVMRLVEITRGEQTSDATLQSAVEFVRSLDKEPVVCHRDLPGFIVNRILGALLNEAALTLQRGEATVDSIDSAARYRLGLPMGMFELADYIGLDVMVSLIEILAAHALLPKVPAVWHEHVDRGELGMKSGRGFHEWSPRPAIPDDAGQDVDTVRLLAPAINSAAQLVEAEAASREDVDKAVRLGLSFPRGILEWSEDLGTALVVDTLRGMEEQYGPWYKPCILLTEATK